MPQVAQIGEEDIKSRLQLFLKNGRELTLELGCGRGDYTLALAGQNPAGLFIGIDIQGERLWYGASQAEALKLNNVFFLRLPIETLADYFPAQSIKTIWITFPDPYPKKRQIKKRLTAPYFLQLYKKILHPGGILHLKTDDQKLWVYTQQSLSDSHGKIIEQIPDLYSRKNITPFLQIQTHFEKKHLVRNKKIYYLCWKF